LETLTTNSKQIKRKINVKWNKNLKLQTCLWCQSCCTLDHHKIDCYFFVYMHHDPPTSP
jgi:hypothetical protein